MHIAFLGQLQLVLKIIVFVQIADVKYCVNALWEAVDLGLSRILN